MDAFDQRLDRQRVNVSAKSSLGKALAYIARHRDGLRVFLAGGRVELDTNAVEKRIRPLALTWKNALFAGPGPRRRGLGSDRVAERDGEDERRRAPRLPQGDA